MSCELALVLPVYNEEECIEQVIRQWADCFEGLGIDFRIIAINDGSRDASWDRMQAYLGRADIELVNKPNEGHGPSILRGYQSAVEVAEWVFQCDSDDEMSADSFPELWQLRNDNDAIFGYRAGREQDAVRKMVTSVSRATVRMFFGSKIRDVNTPYRLMRANMLKQILPDIPADTFAPNVLISGAISRGAWKVAEVAVPHEHRRTGSVSLFRWGLIKASARSFGQTLRFRFSSSGSGRAKTQPRSSS